MHFISDLVLQTTAKGTWDIPQLIVGELPLLSGDSMSLFHVLYRGVLHHSFNVDDLTQRSICEAEWFFDIWRFGGEDDLFAFQSTQRNQRDDRALRPMWVFSSDSVPVRPFVAKPFVVIQGGKK